MATNFYNHIWVAEGPDGKRSGSYKKYTSACQWLDKNYPTSATSGFTNTKTRELGDGAWEHIVRQG